MADRVGRRFGEYRLTRFLGRGSFGDVYLGEHLRGNNLAAVKVLQARLTNEDLKEFINEASTTFRLKHPHIVQLLDFGIGADDALFLVMAYAPNGTLRQRYPKGSRLPLDTVVSYVNQVAEALQYAHDRKLIHRDIKPENILLGQNDELLLSDFGIAIVTHSSRSLGTQNNAGTIVYMAPEQSKGKPCPASDQYALGIIAYEWLCGARPFNGTATEIAMQHLLEPPPSLCEKVPTIPSDVEQVVMTALAKNPQQRFASVQTFAHALAVAAQPLNQQEPSPPSITITSTPAKQVPDTKAALPTRSIQPPPELSAILPELASAIAFSEVGSRGVTINSDPIVSEAAGIASITGIEALATQVREPSILPSLANDREEDHPLMPGRNGARGNGFPRLTRRPLQIAPATILLTLLVFGGLFIAFLGPLKNLIPGVAPSSTITITPASSDLTNTFGIFGVTGTPDPSQRQVQARLLASSAPPQSKTVHTIATSTPGTQATGTITFYNSAFVDQQIGVGTDFLLANGVHIITDRKVDIPKASGTAPNIQRGMASVSAHAGSVGPGGNIAALTIDKACCSADSSIFAKNLAAFTGGRDPQQGGPFVQQSDIDGAASALEKILTLQAQNAVKGQIHPNEQRVNPVQCAPDVASDHNVGDRATSVTVTVTVTCTGEVYDQHGAQLIATNLLKQQAAKTPGYALVGGLITKVTQIMVTDPQKGTLVLQVKAEEILVFQLSDAQKQALANLIAGKSKHDVQTLLLKQAGIARANIVLSGGDGNTLPADPTQITIVVQSVPGLPGPATPQQG